LSQTQKEILEILEQKKLTQKQVNDISALLHFLDDLGLTLYDLETNVSMFKNAKNQNYDLKKIIKYLNHDYTLESSLNEKQSQLSTIEANLAKSQEKHEGLLIKNENLELRYKAKKDSLGTLDDLAKMGVDGNAIILWKQIFDYFGMDPSEFDKTLRTIGTKEKLNRKLENKKSNLTREITKLEKKILWLEENRDKLKSEISNGSEFCKNSLLDISKNAEAQINKTVSRTKDSLDEILKQNQTQVNHAKNQYNDYFEGIFSKLDELLAKSHKAEYDLAKLESLKPIFDLINGKLNNSSLLEVMVILDKLYVQIKDTDLDKHFVSSEIKRLREKLLDLVSHA
jgi:hypothetical protein